MYFKYNNSINNNFGIPMNLQLFAEGSVPSGGAVNGGNAAPLDRSYVSGAIDDGEVQFVSENDEGIDPKVEAAAPQTETDPKQDPKIDSAFAKLRKEKESYEKQKKEFDKWVDKNFGKEFGIKTLEEYQAMMDKQLREAKEAELREQGYDPEVIRSIVKDDPELSKVLENSDEEEMQQQEQQDNEKLLGDYKTLAAEYPDLVQKPEDIPPKVWDLYDNGMSLIDAYTIVNRKAIIDHVKGVGKQQALNNINSKNHLKTEGDGAGEGSDIHMPADTLQMYLDQGFTKKQAFAHYKKLYG